MLPNGKNQLNYSIVLVISAMKVAHALKSNFIIFILNTIKLLFIVLILLSFSIGGCCMECMSTLAI